MIPVSLEEEEVDGTALPVDCETEAMLADLEEDAAEDAEEELEPEPIQLPRSRKMIMQAMIGCFAHLTRQPPATAAQPSSMASALARRSASFASGAHIPAARLRPDADARTLSDAVFPPRGCENVDDSGDVLGIFDLCIVHDVFRMNCAAIDQINAGTAVFAIHELTIVIGDFKVGTAIGALTGTHGKIPPDVGNLYKMSIAGSLWTVKSERKIKTESILVSVKKLLGIAEECTDFDVDIIMYINMALFALVQMGVGPGEG